MHNGHTDWSEDIARAIAGAVTPLKRRVAKLEKELKEVRKLAERPRETVYVNDHSYNP